MFTTIAILTTLVMLMLLAYAAIKPAGFHVERSIAVKASPEKIFALINDFREWNAWTPYNKDPAMKKSYRGAENGVGATYAWKGNREVGKGSVTIMESLPPTKIVIALHMLEPFEGLNRVEFTLEPQGNATLVRWSMDCTQAYLVRVMSLFMNMDKMIGGEFELGLANLKLIAEQ